MEDNTLYLFQLPEFFHNTNDDAIDLHRSFPRAPGQIQARFSEDTDGVLSSDAGIVAKCSDGYWWRSPACRDAVAGCSLEILEILELEMWNL